MTATRTLSPAVAARWAGIGYLALFALAIFANFAVRNSIVVADDPAATMAGIADNEVAFRAGIGAFILIAAIDVGIAWALHVLLRPTGELRSLLAAWLRLTYTVLLGAAVTFMAIALHLATAGDAVAGLGDEARAAWTGTAMEAFDVTWLVGLVLFGLHLVVVGRILVDTRLAPRALGVLLAVAGGAYIVDTFAHVLLPDYASVADVMLVVVALPSMVAEMWFAVWLLARAPRRARALEARAPQPVAA